MKDITLLEVEPGDEWPEQVISTVESTISEDIDTSPDKDNIQETSTVDISNNSDKLPTNLNENKGQKSSRKY